MAYLAGMTWSVSTLFPNFHARPRTTFGNVTGGFPRRPALPGDRPVTTKAKSIEARGGVSVGGACPPCAFSMPVRGRLWAASRLRLRIGSREAWRLGPHDDEHAHSDGAHGQQH